MKKSEFQKIIDEAVAKAIKKLLVDTPFFEALMEEAVQKFNHALKETIVSAGGIAMGPAKKRSGDEFDLVVDDDEDEVVSGEKEKLERTANTILERQGQKIRESMGGFNPFSGSTIESATVMSAADKKVAVNPDGSIAQVSPDDLIVPDNFAEMLGKDAAFQQTMKNVNATKESRFTETEEEEVVEKKKVGRPKRVPVTVLHDEITDSIMADSYGDLDI